MADGTNSFANAMRSIARKTTGGVADHMQDVVETTGRMQRLYQRPGLSPAQAAKLQQKFYDEGGGADEEIARIRQLYNDPNMDPRKAARLSKDLASRGGPGDAAIQEYRQRYNQPGMDPRDIAKLSREYDASQQGVQGMTQDFRYKPVEQHADFNVEDPGMAFEKEAQYGGRFAIRDQAGFAQAMQQGPFVQEGQARQFGQIDPNAYILDTRARDDLGGFIDQLAARGELDPFSRAQQQSALMDMQTLGQIGSPGQQTAASALMKMGGQDLPGTAADQFAAALDQNIAAQRAMAASAKGVSPAMAAQLAQRGTESAMAGAARQSAILAAQEAQANRAQQMQALGQAADVYGAEAGGRLAALSGAAGAGAGLAGQALGQRGLGDESFLAALGQQVGLDKASMGAQMAQEAAIQDFYNRQYGLTQDQLDMAMALRNARMGRGEQSLLRQAAGQAIQAGIPAASDFMGSMASSAATS